MTTVDAGSIPGARVEATFDHKVAQSSFSDSHGVFHLEVPFGTKSVDLRVYAEGFQAFDQEVNPHRLTAEIVVLERTARASAESVANKKKGHLY